MVLITDDTQVMSAMALGKSVYFATSMTSTLAGPNFFYVKFKESSITQDFNACSFEEYGKDTEHKNGAKCGEMVGTAVYTQVNLSVPKEKAMLNGKRNTEVNARVAAWGAPSDTGTFEINGYNLPPCSSAKGSCDIFMARMGVLGVSKDTWNKPNRVKDPTQLPPVVTEVPANVLDGNSASIAELFPYNVDFSDDIDMSKKVKANIAARSKLSREV